MTHPEEKTCTLHMGDVVFRRASNGWIVIYIDTVEAQAAAHDYCAERHTVYEAPDDSDDAMKAALVRAAGDSLNIYISGRGDE